MRHRQPNDSHDALLDRAAFKATVHCLKFFAIGDILGMAIGKAVGAGAVATIVLAVTLAFLSAYLLTLVPLIRSGLAYNWAIGLVFTSITASIATMAIVDNAVMLMVPGAMDAGFDTPLYWSSLVVSLIVGSFAAFPVNRYLIARHRGYTPLYFYW